MPHDCTVELSPVGVKFLTEIFQAYDKVRVFWIISNLVLTSDHSQDQDGDLNQTELEDLFSTSPGNPWANNKFPDTTVTSETGRITLQGWLAQWRYDKLPIGVSLPKSN